MKHIFSILVATVSLSQAFADHGLRTERGHDRNRRSSPIGIVYGLTDSCDMSKVVDVIRHDTNCEELSSAGSSWSVKIGEQCVNISDTDARSACRGIQADKAQNIIFGLTDSCDMGKIEAVLDDEDIYCENLSSSARSWSIKRNGVCVNISDTDVRSACNSIRYENARNVIYGLTDSCDDTKVIGALNRRTRCEDFSSSERSWSVKIDGACVNISDTDAQSACKSIRYRNAPNVIYGLTDSCDETKVITTVDHRTSCRALSNSERSWSVKINGTCVNISDTTVSQACFAIQTEM